MHLRPLHRLGIPALALGQGLSEIGFVLAARAGLKHGDSLPLAVTLMGAVLLRFAFQDRGAALEARALRDTVSALRGRLLDAVKARAVPAYRPDIRRALRRALEETVPRAAEGLLARRHLTGALLQIALFVPLLFFLSWQAALLGLGFAALLWPVLRWRNRRLRTLEAEGVRGRGDSLRALDDFGDSLESRAGHGLAEAVQGLDAALDAAHRPEWRWRRARLRYPAVLETGLFFVLAALLVAGSFLLPDWNALLLFSLLLLLAYRPVREAARHYPIGLAGAGALGDIEGLAGNWESLPARRAPDAHPAGNLFALRDVDFGYETGHPVFAGFSAEFPAGAVTGVTGPNGAGKTTLLRLLSGAEIPTRGEVLWTQDARVRGVAYLPQRSWPGADWAAWAGELKAKRPEQWRALDSLLRLKRLVDKSAHPEALSGGERQRMALARTLCSDAAFLLLDEPTTALPGDEREDILKGALDFWRRSPHGGGRGGIVVSHESFLPALCDSMMRIDASSTAARTEVVFPVG